MRLKLDYHSKGASSSPYSKKDIFLYIDLDINFTGLVQPLDKIVVRSSHNLSLFDRFEPELWIFGEFIDNIVSYYKQKKVSKYTSFINKWTERRINSDSVYSSDRRAGKDRRAGIDRRKK